MRIVAFLVLSLLTASTTVAICITQDIRVARIAIELRERPLESARALATVPRDSVVQVNMCSDAWCHVAFRSWAGFVPETAFVAMTGPSFWIARAVILVRAAADSRADIVGTIPRDSAVTVSNCADGWCAITDPGIAGFAPESTLTRTRAAPRAAPTPVTPPPGSRQGVPPPPPPPPTRACCRICTTGKACGNSCIARNRTCRQPPGCACNGDMALLPIGRESREG